MKSNSGKIISSIKNNESKLALEFPPATVAIPYAAFSYVINLNNFFLPLYCTIHNICRYEENH